MNGQAEWGYVYKGQILMSAVDENGANQVDILNEVGGIQGHIVITVAHSIRGIFGIFRKVKHTSFKVWPTRMSIFWLLTMATLTRLVLPLWSMIGLPIHQKTSWQRTLVSHKSRIHVAPEEILIRPCIRG